VSHAHVRATLAKLLPTADVVLVSTEIPIAAVSAAVEAVAQTGVQCVLNPAPMLPGLVDLLRLGPILTPNEIELQDLARGLSGKSAAGSEEEIPNYLQHLGERTRAPVIVTLGGEGCAVCLLDGEVVWIPARTTNNVVDTTGAGDTFNGILAARLAEGDPIVTAVSTAAIGASLSVTMAGARAGMPNASAISSAIG
jgi:ribokinase